MVSPLQHALLAFDGSPKSKEALFVAAYLAEQWKTQLTIFTGLKNKPSNEPAEGFARSYLEFNEVEARFIPEQYSPETMRKAADEVHADFVIMGGSSGSILKEVTGGTSVNAMLRELQLPVLICR
jgi:nucleotide-binding universal stress UspA family protein